jgi:hypothetical protein
LMGRFTHNLSTFFSLMEDNGFTVRHMQYYTQDEIQDHVKESDYDSLARMAESVEQCNVVLGNGEYRQGVMVMYSGDEYCDYVPIADWTFKYDKPDVVSEVIDFIRRDID